MNYPKRPAMLNQKTENRALNVLFSVLSVLLCAVLIASIWFHQTYFVVTVDGASMLDTLQNHDRVYANAYAKAKRGDIVIIDVTPYPDKYTPNVGGGEKLIIKRLIATEGDSIYCENGTVYWKESGGEYRPLSEPYALSSTLDFEEVTVGEDEIFFLGDNRSLGNNNLDSRIVGCLSYKDIVGVVPEWSIKHKDWITRWEGLRRSAQLSYGNI
jgi:signal peptidase I